MIVSAWPAYTLRQWNRTHDRLYDNLAALGVTVHEFSAKRILSQKPDILHIHWPEMWLSYAPAWQARLRNLFEIWLIDRLKSKGTKLFWTGHNIHSHERKHPQLEDWLYSKFTARVDGLICLSDSSRQMVVEKYPVLKLAQQFVIPHGHYRGIYPENMSGPEARATFGLDDSHRVFSYIGMIRPYKNVPKLISTFAEISDPNARLLIGGKPGDAVLREQIEKAAERDPRVTVKLEHLPEDDLQRFVRAADAVVLPFAEILNSGTAILALSFDRPVLVPGKGSMGELQQVVGADWVRTYDGELNATLLQETMAWARQPSRPSRAPLDGLDWGTVAKMHYEAFRKVKFGKP